MEFRKYQHIERFGTTEVEHIEVGKCYLFPKIDGTNSQVYLNESGEVCAGSRNRVLSLDADNGGFLAHIVQQDNIKRFLTDNPTLRLYGEWLIPHSLRTYRDDCWRKFYVFDVIEELGNDEFRYLPYEEYQALCEKYEIDYLPPVAIINNPSYENLLAVLQRNIFLIKDGCGVGEGIVIKRYNYKNKYGRTTWAKIVTSEFKEKHAKVMRNGNNVEEGKKMVEQLIVDKYVTSALCDKVLAKIVAEKGEWKSQYIPLLLSTVYYDLVREDCWHFIKEHKFPSINFKTLQVVCNERVKCNLSHLF